MGRRSAASLIALLGAAPLGAAALLNDLQGNLRGPGEVDWAGVRDEGPIPVECQCQEWRSVYKDQNIQCGQGLEYFFEQKHNSTGHIRVDPFLKDMSKRHEDICTKFFTKLPKNFGVRIKYNSVLDMAGKEWFDASWCYVKGSCKDLRGGGRIPGTRLSWKITQQGFHDMRDPNSDKNTDHNLQQLEPTSLLKMARAAGLDLPIALGFAYYRHPYLDIPALTGFGMSSTEQTRMASMTGLPVVIHATNNDRRRIVKGKNVWEMSKANATALAAHPGAIWDVQKMQSAPAHHTPGLDPEALEAEFARETKERDEKLKAGSFLQLSAGRRQRSDGDSCRCLEWAKVYTEHQVKCGQGLELAHYPELLSINATSLPADHPILEKARKDFDYGDVLCIQLLERLTGNFAIRMRFNTASNQTGEWFDGNWCYVSSGCSDLGGGAPIPGTDVSWKVSPHGQDFAIRDIDPQDLISMAVHFGYNLRTLSGYAYYVNMGNHSSAINPQAIQLAQSSGETTVLEPSDTLLKPRRLAVRDTDLQPRRIVKGEAEWVVRQNEPSKQVKQWPGSWWNATKLSNVSSKEIREGLA